MLSLSLPMNYVDTRLRLRLHTPRAMRTATAAAVRWTSPAVTKREKLLRQKAIEEGALPKMRVMILQDFVERLRNDIYLYTEGQRSQRSIEITVNAMRIVVENLVKDYPKNKHAGLIRKKLHVLYELICMRLFNPLCSRFDAADYILTYVDEASQLMTSVLQWHSKMDTSILDI